MATDFYLLDERLTDEERAIRDRAARLLRSRRSPRSSTTTGSARSSRSSSSRRSPSSASAGGVIEGYGCPGMSAIAAGLVSMEWARADGSIGHLLRRALQPRDAVDRTCSAPRSSASAGCRAMAALEADRRLRADRARPRLRRRRAWRRARARDGDEFVLDGAKKWIGNASFADFVIIWARGEDGQVGGYVVEKGAPGFEHRGHHGQDVAARGVAGRDHADGVRVPAENRLPGCRSFRDVARVLDPHPLHGRLARARASRSPPTRRRWPTPSEREQFGQPIAAFQLVQDKLSRMLGEITAMQLLCLRLSRAGRRRAPDARRWPRWPR